MQSPRTHGVLIVVGGAIPESILTGCELAHYGSSGKGALGIQP
jgi:hypothetical protein